MQAAFKSPAMGTGTPKSSSQSREGRAALDWDKIRPEDKTLVHQASLCLSRLAVSLLMPCIDVATMNVCHTHPLLLLHGALVCGQDLGTSGRSAPFSPYRICSCACHATTGIRYAQ